MSRYNELLHGDLETVSAHIACGDLNHNETLAALANVCSVAERLQERVESLEYTLRIERNHRLGIRY